MSTTKGTGASKPGSGAKLLPSFRSIAIFLFFISGIINVLALTGSFYMMQVYDRALTSGSVPTLVALSVLAVGLYAFQGGFDVLRSQILVRIGARFDREVAPVAHAVVLDMPRYGYSSAEALERGRDVDTVRSFLGGQGPVALFDLPWIPLYLGFVYLLHPTLGMVTLAGALLLTSLTILTEIFARNVSGEMHQAAVSRNVIADGNARNAEVLRAMGFARHAVARFERLNAKHLELQTRSNDVGGSFGGLSKVLRMILQSATLGVGAYLTIKGELSAGAIIAASVASARALAPVDMAIAQWKGLVAARRSHQRLRQTLDAFDDGSDKIALPPPTTRLQVENVTVVAPGTGTVLLSDVSFYLRAGTVMGLIGPSGGGKTSLARGLVGVWPLLRGNVRLDGADLDQWSPESLGRHIGYLPQDVSLFEGTIAENICRLDPKADSASIIKAARAAGVHEMIVRLPNGYQTEIGPKGVALSAGQRQRIGLARALYGDPFLVVLDEPNSNLDAEGETALGEAIAQVKARGGIAVVIAHRPSALVHADMVGVIRDGRLIAFGPKDEIIRDSSRPSVVPVTSPSHARDVG